MDVVSGVDVFNSEDDEDLPLVDDLIRINRGALVLVHGAPNVGKSFLVLRSAFAVAAAGENAFLVAGESSLRAIRRRVRGLAENEETPLEALARLRFVLHPPALEADGFEALAEAVEAANAELIVLDPLAALFTGDENSASAVGAFLRQLREFTAQGVAVVLVHHDRKSTATSGADIRGSSALRAAADDVFALRESDGRTVVSHTKARDTRRRPDLAFRIVENDEGAFACADTSTVQPSKHSALSAEIERALGNAPMTPTLLRTLLNRSSAAVNEALVSLESQGRVVLRPGPSTGKRGRPAMMVHLASQVSSS